MREQEPLTPWHLHVTFMLLITACKKKLITDRIIIQIAYPISHVHVTFILLITACNKKLITDRISKPIAYQAEWVLSSHLHVADNRLQQDVYHRQI
jgi:hypothetical protein